MPTQHLATRDAIVVGVPMMDAAEAREAISLMHADIGMVDSYADSFRRRALDFRDREGWKALGYSGAAEAINAELGTQYSKSYLSRLLQAAEVEQALELPIGNSVPESVLRPLTKLDTPDQQRAAYQAATVNGPATAKKVQQAADEAQGATPVDLQRGGVQLTRHGSWFKATGFSGVMNGWATPAAQPYVRTVEAARAELARRTAAAAAAPTEAEYEDVQARLAKHGTWLTRRKQENGIPLYVTKQDGKSVGIATPTWSNVTARLEHLERKVAPPAAPAPPIETDDQAMIADIRSLAEPLDLQMIWEDGKVLLYWRGEEDEIDQMDMLSYGAALEWLTWEAKGVKQDAEEDRKQALARLDEQLPPLLFKAGYFWKLANPPTIAHYDGWHGDAPTIEQALQLGRDHLRKKLDNDPRLQAAQLLKQLAPLLLALPPADQEGLSQAISDLNECEEGTEVQHWLSVGAVLIGMESEQR